MSNSLKNIVCGHPLTVEDAYNRLSNILGDEHVKIFDEYAGDIPIFMTNNMTVSGEAQYVLLGLKMANRLDRTAQLMAYVPTLDEIFPVLGFEYRRWWDSGSDNPLVAVIEVKLGQA